MKIAHVSRRWNAVGLNGIHCAISCCDALTVYFLGLRNAGERHEDVVNLIQQINSIDTQTKKMKISQILDVIRPKTRVEYHADLFTENEAAIIVKQADRIYSWAKELLQ